ncbi:ribbon-helix-helix domain-containing protein [Paracoccus endophyticus]|uniref:ribbon-helix-helix domain-containing protein n=1 Tax=Paracoccus endophyticus TaxID=2233774 RepID=UPI000DD5F2EC|nr:ribbon-helix-helix domain-containing protein [Paracoccus endophyticus]
MCRMFAMQDMRRYQPLTRRLRLNGQSTSIRLERAFWQILDEIAREEGMTTPAFLSRLHNEVLMRNGEAENFTSLLRCACLTRTEMGAEAALAARPPDLRRMSV